MPDAEEAFVFECPEKLVLGCYGSGGCTGTGGGVLAGTNFKGNVREKSESGYCIPKIHRLRCVRRGNPRACKVECTTCP